MNRLITYGSVDAIPFYNCSWKSSEEWLAVGVKRPWLGIPAVIAGVAIELLYFPVIYLIFKTKLIKLTCYKVMTLLALNDMAATVCSSLITGTLLTQGAVFCSSPTFIYIAGTFTLSTWGSACAITSSLFLNRIVSIAFKEYADIIEKRLAYASMVLCVVYLFFLTWFTPPPLFNSEVMAWLPNPLSEPEPSEEAMGWYENAPQNWNNMIFPMLMAFLFTVYGLLVKKLENGQTSKASRSIFIQCSAIGFVNTVIAIVYRLLPFLSLAPWIFVVCQICWIVNHGLPAFIYVTMNATIRREIKKLLCGKHRVDGKHSSMVNTTSISQKV